MIETIYYLGDENDGAAKTGWLDLGMMRGGWPGRRRNHGSGTRLTSTPGLFQTNGRAVKATGDEGYVNRTSMVQILF